MRVRELRALNTGLRELIAQEIAKERKAILERIVKRIAAGKCPKCMAWDCARDIAETISGAQT